MGKMIDLPRGSLQRLAQADPRLGRVIKHVGAFAMQRQGGRSHYDLLARAIVFQQLSGKAAGTIFKRLCALSPGPGVPTAPAMLALGDYELRAAGLSRQKVAALRDLARHVSGAALGLSRISRLSDENVIERLCAVRGIGRWTAEMFLMFRLGRLDVLPVSDLGIRKGVALLDDQADLPTPAEVLKRGQAWRPLRTVASWYLWRAVDDANLGQW